VLAEPDNFFGGARWFEVLGPLYVSGHFAVGNIAHKASVKDMRVGFMECLQEGREEGPKFGCPFRGL